MVLLLAMQVLITACGTQVLLDSADRATGREHPAMQDAEAATSTASHRAVDLVTMQRFERANRAITAEEWSAAIEELHWLVENRGDLSGPCLNLALVYQYQNTPEEAEKYYRQALQVNPANLTAHNQYGIFLREQGRFTDAEQSYLRALEVREAHPETHRNIGVLYDLYMGDRQRALHHFNRYQDLSGSDDVTVAGWIADLQRQLLSLAQGGQPQ